ncbi:hypothetical protein Tco_1027364 [Tanacetum coccineum]
MSTNSVSILHNAIMKASGKNQTPMLALSNYITRLATPATDDAPTQEEKEVLDTYATIRENIKKMIDVEAKAVHIILNGIDNYICSIVDACPNAKEMWKAIGHLKQVTYHKLFDILKQHQNEMNEIRAERQLRKSNPLVLVAASQQPVYHTQAKPTYYTQTSSSRSHADTQIKGK